MSDTKPFLWAQGQEANIKEPIEALREHGWRYGDVPTASNFNWLFKNMTEELAALRRDLLAQQEEFSQSLAEQARDHEIELAEMAESFNAKIARLNNWHNYRTKHLATSLEVTWGLLRDFQQLLRHYHRDMPSVPWPVSVWPHQNKEENEPTLNRMPTIEGLEISDAEMS